jgi:hypothetical protein
VRSILLPDTVGRAILTFGYAPPRADYDPHKLARIRQPRTERLARVNSRDFRLMWPAKPINVVNADESAPPHKTDRPSIA